MRSSNTLAACLFLLLVRGADTSPGQTLLTTHIAQLANRANFTDLINHRPDGGDFVPIHVVGLLKTLSDKPECHKVATHQLITSCQSIREDALQPKPSLEDLEKRKSIFAARLAICELQEANANTPPQCKPILSGPLTAYDSSSSRSPQRSGDQQVSSDELRKCLRALEAKPQSWTSYSNSRQHAALICDVSRSQIIKDEALSLFHLLTGLGSDLVQALADALQRGHSRQEAEMEFAEALKKLHNEQVQDLARSHRAHQAVIEESNNQLTNVVSYVSDTISSARRSAADLKQMVEAIFLSAATGGAELASIRLRDAEANHEVALALKEMVQDVASNDFAILLDSLKEAIDTAVRANRAFLVDIIANLEQGATRHIIQSAQEDSSGLREVN
jgi:hypothetical protein